jgi:hypothetical protein
MEKVLDARGERLLKPRIEPRTFRPLILRFTRNIVGALFILRYPAKCQCNRKSKGQRGLGRVSSVHSKLGKKFSRM